MPLPEHSSISSKADRSIDPRILESAKQEFLTSGFEKASLKHICEQAGVTTGALYKRYRGKEDLFCAVVADYGLGFVFDLFGPLKALYSQSTRLTAMNSCLDRMEDPLRCLPAASLKNTSYL